MEKWSHFLSNGGSKHKTVQMFMSPQFIVLGTGETDHLLNTACGPRWLDDVKASFPIYSATEPHPSLYTIYKSSLGQTL